MLNESEPVHADDGRSKHCTIGLFVGGGHELHRAFRKFHTGGGHAITLPEFQKAVLDFGFVLSPDEVSVKFALHCPFLYCI